MDSLDALWKDVQKLNKKHFPGNDLMPVLGGGKSEKPKFMFVFINPTVRNISSGKEWKGSRVPFVGTKQFWRVFYNAGLFEKSFMENIEKGDWSNEFACKVYDFLSDNGFYFTNLVKWTGENADLPDGEKIKLFLPIIRREIEIVKPEYVVTFGGMPFESLTREKIKLKDYFDDVEKNNKLKIYNVIFDGLPLRVIPCYFPVGRGNPKRATRILELLKSVQHI